MESHDYIKTASSTLYTQRYSLTLDEGEKKRRLFGFKCLLLFRLLMIGKSTKS